MIDPDAILADFNLDPTTHRLIAGIILTNSINMDENAAFEGGQSLADELCDLDNSELIKIAGHAIIFGASQAILASILEEGLKTLAAEMKKPTRKWWKP